MQTIVRKGPAVAQLRPQTHATYLDDLDSVLETEPEVEQMTPHKPIPHHVPRANSLWALGDLLANHTAVLDESVGHCRPVTPDLRHFNLGWHELRNVVMHCDFRSVPLPEVADALNRIRAAQLLWEEALRGDVDADELADITYADIDYPPRPRRYLNVDVRIDQTATRVERRYTDSDAEVWGP
jgi:hypothetical protein